MSGDSCGSARTGSLTTATLPFDVGRNDIRLRKAVNTVGYFIQRAFINLIISHDTHPGQVRKAFHDCHSVVTHPVIYGAIKMVIE